MYTIKNEDLMAYYLKNARAFQKDMSDGEIWERCAEDMSEYGIYNNNYWTFKCFDDYILTLASSLKHLEHETFTDL